MRDKQERETDLYAVLNVPSDATEAQLKRAYKSLASSYHPDKHSQLSEELQVGAIPVLAVTVVGCSRLSIVACVGRSGN